MITKKTRSNREESFFLRNEDVTRTWFIFDAEGKTLGRFASEVANVLRGKHKPSYTPSTDSGDGVIVINADKIVVTGNKEATKLYRYYTGFIGGLRETTYRTMMDKKPEYIIEHAVKGMVPRNKQGRAQMKRLRIFAGIEHGMEAQQPVKVNI